MKKHISILVIAYVLLFLFYSCTKNDSKPEDSVLLIKSMGSIGDFHYDNGKLVKMGDQEFFYDVNGRLAKSTELINDTTESGDQKWGIHTRVDHRYTIYSYQWQGEHVSKIHIDSLNLTSYLDGELMQERILGDLPFAELSYQANHLSTISYTMYLYYGSADAKQVCTITHAYSDDNLSQTDYTYTPEGINVLPGLGNIELPPLETTLTYATFDQHINPFSLIQTYLGVVPPSLFNANHSANNVLSAWSSTNREPDKRVEYNYTYTYNDAGAPILITTSNEPGKPQDNVKISYY